MPLFSTPLFTRHPGLRPVRRTLAALRRLLAPHRRRDDLLAESTDMVDLERRLHALDRLATLDAHVRLSFLRHRH
jgi:hypothetical protein